MSERIDLARGKAERRRTTRLALISLYDVENNAVRVLAANLRRHGHHVTEIYFKDWRNNHFDPPSEVELAALCRILRDDDIDLPGISIRASAYYRVAVQLTRTIHDELGLPVFWGGNHPTLVPDQCIPWAEILCRGESDDAIVEMANAIATGGDLSELPNLWVREDDGTVHKNPLRSLATGLDHLPFRDYTSPHKYWILGRNVRQGDPMVTDPVFQMMASRGCIFKCAYCYNSTYQNDLYQGQRFYRTRSVSSLIQEINQAKGAFRKMKRVRFDDEVFNFNQDWLEEFLDRYPKEVGLPFECFLEPQLVYEEKLVKMKKAGLRGVYMGVQNAETVNEGLYDRNSSDKHIKDLAQIYHKLDLHIHFQLIFDDPVATSESKQALFELVSSFPRPYDLYLFSMTIFPESALAKKLTAMGLITAEDIEGLNTRTFYQHRVDLTYPRPPEDQFWISLIVLLSKSFVPIPFIRALSKSETLKRNPAPLVKFAQSVNVVKMGALATRMLLRGEMTPTLVHRWLNTDSLITA